MQTASMPTQFALPFGRIFWKEYRSNRALWLSCLVIGILMQLWILIFTGMTVGRIDHDFRQNGIIGITCFIPILYAVGCCAVLFAGERENGTVNWLLALGAPPLPMLSGKLLFGVLSTIGLQLALAVTACVFLISEQVHNLHYLLIPMGLAGLVWATLGSLTSRQALVSVFVMAFWLVCPLLAFNLFLECLPRSSWIDALATANLSILGSLAFCTNILVGWKWSHGQYLDGTLLERWGSALRALYCSLTKREMSQTRVLSRLEYEQSWRRQWQRLVWQERHGERKTYFWIALGSSLAVLGGLLSFIYGQTGPRQATDIWVWFNIVSGFYATMIGILCFQVDARGQQSQFLANRGVAPALLWLVKQVVWLPRAFCLPIIVAVLACVGFYIHSSFQFSHVWTLVTQVIYGEQSNWITGWQNRGIGYGLTIQLYCWILLLNYASGQLASLLFRRTVLAVAFSGALLFGTGAWIVTVEALRLSDSWLYPLAFALLLLFTLWQVNPWLLELDSWKRRGQIAVALVALPCVLLAALSIARVEEVAVAPRLYPWTMTSLRSDPVDQSAFDPEAPEYALVRNRLNQLTHIGNEPVQKRAAEIVQLIQQNRNVVLWAKHPQLDVWSRYRRGWMPFEVELTLETAAKLHLNAGELDRAFDCYLAILQLGRNVGLAGRQTWFDGVEFQAVALELLVDWSSDQRQTPEAIRTAIKKIEDELNFYPAYSGLINQSYLQDQIMLMHSSADEMLIKHHEKTADTAQMGFWKQFGKLVIFNPAERLRARLLLTLQAELDKYEAQATEYAVASNRWLQTDDELRRFTELNKKYESLRTTSPLVRMTNLDKIPVSDLIKTHTTVKRAALIRLHLVLRRLETGRMPSELIELAPHMDPYSLVDPWTGQQFEYHPAFLFSTGPDKFQLTYKGDQRVSVTATVNRHQNAIRMHISKLDPVGRLFEGGLRVNGSHEELEAQRDMLRNASDLSLSLFPIPAKPTLENKD